MEVVLLDSWVKKAASIGLLVFALNVETSNLAYAGFEIGKENTLQVLDIIGTREYCLNLSSILWLENLQGPVVTAEIAYMEILPLDKGVKKYRFGDKYYIDLLYNCVNRGWSLKETDKNGNYYWRELNSSQYDDMIRKLIEMLGAQLGVTFV